NFVKSLISSSFIVICLTNSLFSFSKFSINVSLVFSSQFLLLFSEMYSSLLSTFLICFILLSYVSYKYLVLFFQLILLLSLSSFIQEVNVCLVIFNSSDTSLKVFILSPFYRDFTLIYYYKMKFTSKLLFLFTLYLPIFIGTC